MQGWCDAHCHVSSMDAALATEQLTEAIALGCQIVVDVATDLSSLEHSLRLQAQFPQLRTCAAITPHDAHLADQHYWQQIERLMKQGQLCAIGETGLDYHYWGESAGEQKLWLARHLQLAASASLPIVIHCRDAFEDLFTLLDNHYCKAGTWLPGMLHCFTGNQAEAERLLSHGWIISISGIVTFPKSTELREVVSSAPLSQLVIETDAPWLAPHPYRGQPCRLAWALKTIDRVAACKGVAPEQVAEITLQNCRALFGCRVSADTQKMKQAEADAYAPHER